MATRDPVIVRLPTFHPDQVKAYHAYTSTTNFALRAGRRYGKTDFGKTIACDAAVKRELVGWFAPDYKRLRETFTEIDEILGPVKKSSSHAELFRTTTGGRIDFWTLEDDSAGRSRKYHKVIIDEGAFTKPNMMDIWLRSIQPTLLDYRGSAMVMSNTNGDNPENFFWQICHQEKHGFALPGQTQAPFGFHAPSINNPYVPGRRAGLTDVEHEADRQAYFAKLKADTPPLVYRQEYEAEFVDWSGAAFFSLPSLLVDDKPVDAPILCDAVFAVVDTATKTGRENDGTAVTYFAFTKHEKYPVRILDWDIVQIEGSLLEVWLPEVFKNLEVLAIKCKARMGSLGAWIEDKASGMVLIQQAARHNWPARAIESKLTSVGKDERAISVSGYVFRGEVKLTQPAFEKVSIYKGTSRNHFIGQVTGFRIGDKDAAKRDDDLLDTFCYGVAIALGDDKGF